MSSSMATVCFGDGFVVFRLGLNAAKLKSGEVWGGDPRIFSGDRQYVSVHHKPASPIVNME